MENLKDRITIDPKICNGKPTIRSKRITVNTILEFLSAGDSFEDILKQYPGLEEKDIYACLYFAADLLNKNYMIKPVV
jgi:uncharacterized protein (DUF433 family)